MCYAQGPQDTRLDVNECAQPLGEQPKGLSAAARPLARPGEIPVNRVLRKTQVSSLIHLLHTKYTLAIHIYTVTLLHQYTKSAILPILHINTDKPNMNAQKLYTNHHCTNTPIYNIP